MTRPRARKTVAPEADDLVSNAAADGGVLNWMRHEILTPINALLGMADLLLDTDPTPAQREYLRMMRASAETLSATVNDLLDLCRMESGRLALEAQAFDLREAVEQSFDRVAGAAAERGLDLVYRIDEAAPLMVVGDAARLRQVLETLLAGAVKRTHNGEVSVSVAARAAAGGRHEVRFVVADTGMTIPDEQRARLFQPLSRVVAGGRAADAQELGLALCHGLTRLMDGTIAVASGADGSTFDFTIAVEGAPRDPAARVRRVPLHLAGRRVLIVDDNPRIRELLLAYLAGWGLAARGAASLTEARDGVRAGDRFDIVLIDARLPGDPPDALIDEIGRSRGGCAPAVVMLQGPGTRSAARGIRHAALVQPVGPAQLLDVLARAAAGDRPPAAPETAAPGSPPLRVLLAEDNAVSQKVALEVLRRLGHHADVVEDGREVVAALERCRYDVVLMDLQMPGMDGLAVTREVCERWPPDRRPRIVALSASELPEDRMLWLAAGADGWIGKALPVEDLRRELAGAAPRRGAAAAPPVPAVENVVENLRRLETRGTPGFADEVLDAFLRDAADQLATLRVAVARRDAGGVERAAHGLKGNASMVGAASLARTCEELIGLARAGSLDAGEPVVRQLDAAIGAIRRSAADQSRAAGSPGGGPKVVE